MTPAPITEVKLLPMRKAGVPQKRFARTTLLAIAAASAVTLFAGKISSNFAAPTIGRGVGAPAQETLTVLFVSGPECRGSSKVAMAAEKKPGGPPGKKVSGKEAWLAKMAEEVPPEEVDDGTRPGDETDDEQMDRVAKRAKMLKGLKGKFVPVGPKPWDTHRFTKVCIQTRLKVKQASNTKIINQVVEELRRISGMHPKVVKAKHNVASFGWRVGYPCGVAVSITGPLMYDFLARLNTVILPRVRDFEGLLPSSFDNYGNFWMGVQNQEPFKELDSMIDERQIVHGFDIGILNNVMTQPDGLKLMKDYGFPFGDPRARKAKAKKVSFQVMKNEGASKPAAKKPAKKR